jgi:hypothetical protein
MANESKPAHRGRVTPKGGGGRVTGKGTPTVGTSSGRYTPPIPREVKVSPMWVPVVMFTFLGIGMLMIVLNYLGWLPGAASNWYLLGGLGCITVGFITATQYH